MPLIVAHRGASGYRPEHTLAAYRLAIQMGADYIEPDVVSTSDGVLVARHENEISGTTDVASRPEFAARHTTKRIDGVELTGWFTEDFTLAELKTLRTKERLPRLRIANTAYDGRYEIATLDEIIDVVDDANATRDDPVGLYIEIKHPNYFNALGIDLCELLLVTLSLHGLDETGAKVFIESMEPSSLCDLRSRTPLPLIQLLKTGGRPYDFAASGDPRTYADLTTAAGLASIAEYADGIGPHKDQVIARDADANLTAATGLVAAAHGLGLLVHAWTIRNENSFLPANLRTPGAKDGHGDVAAECIAFFDAGVDGLFCDHPDTAIEARRQWLASHP